MELKYLEYFSLTTKKSKQKFYHYKKKIKKKNNTTTKKKKKKKKKKATTATIKTTSSSSFVEVTYADIQNSSNIKDCLFCLDNYVPKVIVEEHNKT